MIFINLMWYVSYIVLIPGLIFAIIADINVKRTFNKYSKIPSKNNWTGGDLAKMLLEKNDCRSVVVSRTSGNYTDNYNPNDQTLNLSDPVYSGNSVLSIGVASHECGHAVQHNTGYFLLTLRSLLVPATKIGSCIALPLALFGVIIEWLSQDSTIGPFIIALGILFYSLSTIFWLITLPVEINASHRARKFLREYGIVDKEEYHAVGKVLTAAAFTYVANLLVSFLYLLRFLMIISSLRRRR